MMTGLDNDPWMVSLVQVVSSLPMLLFALPAGALADIVDRRRLLILVQALATLVVSVLALLVWLDNVTPQILLGLTFLVATSAALVAPAWQSIVPQLVPRSDLQNAVALNSAGFNVARAIGPALAGLAIGAFGLAMPFWLNAASNLAVIGALIWWSPSPQAARSLPSEAFNGAIRAGLRHATHNAHLRAILVRAAGFFLFASAYWALLPLLAREQVKGGPGLYGIMLAAIGIGAVGGALLLPLMKNRLGPDNLTAAGTVATAIALLLFAVAMHPLLAITACVLAGSAWITALATVNAAAQLALPPWVRGRGLAIYVAVQFGTIAIGSAIWGKLAALVGLPAAHGIAALGALLSLLLSRRWPLHTAADIDLAPSLHWPQPIMSREIDHDRGPVMVTVRYRVDHDKRADFFRLVSSLADERRRDGAYAWHLFEDVAEHGRLVEIFFVDSWLEHLRQHERVTNADRVLQEELRGCLSEPPEVTHAIAADLSEADRPPN
jgi:MFS family permease